MRWGVRQAKAAAEAALLSSAHLLLTIPHVVARCGFAASLHAALHARGRERRTAQRQRRRSKGCIRHDGRLLRPVRLQRRHGPQRRWLLQETAGGGRHRGCQGVRLTPSRHEEQEQKQHSPHGRRTAAPRACAHFVGDPPVQRVRLLRLALNSDNNGRGPQRVDARLQVPHGGHRGTARAGKPSPSAPSHTPLRLHSSL